MLGYADEFGNIGAIPDMARWMSTVRSARMGFLLAVQDLAQLGAIYGKEGRQIIVTDCSTKIALAKTSADDAEWFSRGSGTATVLACTAGDSRKRGERLARSGSRGMSEVARPLLTPARSRGWPTDTMLVLSGNRQPMLVRQQRWYQERRLRRLGRMPVPWRREPGTHGAERGHSSGAPGQRRDAARAVPGPEPAPVQDDGAIQLDHDLPAGAATWVQAPDAWATVAPGEVPTAALTGTESGFDVLQDG